MDSDEKRVLKRKRHTIAQNVTLTEELVEALRNSNLLTNSIYDQVIVSDFCCALLTIGSLESLNPTFIFQCALVCLVILAGSTCIFLINL